MSKNISRRGVLKSSAAIGIGVSAADLVCGGIEPGTGSGNLLVEDSCLTSANDFYTVARGNPKPHTLKGEDLVKARMTPDSWRLEIGIDQKVDPPVVKQKATAEKELSIADETALDYQSLLNMSQSKSVKLIKAIQCLNIDRPLGQGLWEGVALRDILMLCGKIKNVRRVFFWGFHNNDPKQLFQSSLSYTQAVENAPNDPPVFLALRLNGEPLTPVRGGPVRMIVPWAYGFKSIKWLQKIVLSNDPRPNDTYANQNNDPESPLKTAAYLSKTIPKKVKSGDAFQASGVVISGLSGLEKVQFLVRPVETFLSILPYDDPLIQEADWKTADVTKPPSNWGSILPKGIKSNDLFGFDSKSGQPKAWPLRYGMTNWSTTINNLKPGRYEFRVRAVDKNGFAQPEPRPLQKSGRNAMPLHFFTVNE